METTFNMFIETEVPENKLIISRTDFSGVITYINETFADISGYTVDELVGKPHNIIRHPDMPRSTFATLWETLKRGETWEGYVKNLRKDRGYYWVSAQISLYYRDGEPAGYKSIREPVSREKKIEIQRLYDRMRAEEENTSRVVLYVDNDRLRDLEAFDLQSR